MVKKWQKKIKKSVDKKIFVGYYEKVIIIIIILNEVK